MNLSEVPEEDRDAVDSALKENSPNTVTPLEVLASVGGFELGMLAGMILACASIHVPVVLDDQGTSAAALLAARLAPDVSGYLIAAHAGASPIHRRALSELELTALFELGLAHGEGTGAALALPIVDSAASLLAE
jgi:nicotinate-nucleotide--dimethylbenzimidazole phosphoribosyltransferase